MLRVLGTALAIALCLTVSACGGVDPVGGPKDRYPGDPVVESKTRDYCSRNVGAWLGYPDSYDFGYTWFHDDQWQAGNRRSVCWARTTA